MPQLRPIQLGSDELRAIVERVVIEPEKVQRSPLDIDRSDEDTFRIGVVLSIGTAARKKCPEIEIGMRVLYAASGAATNAAKRGDAERHVVHSDHVLCEVYGPGVTTR